MTPRQLGEGEGRRSGRHICRRAATAALEGHEVALRNGKSDTTDPDCIAYSVPDSILSSNAFTPEGFHGNADASVFAALHRADDLRRRHGAAARHRHFRPQGVRPGADPDADLR